MRKKSCNQQQQGATGHGSEVDQICKSILMLFRKHKEMTKFLWEHSEGKKKECILI